MVRVVAIVLLPATVGRYARVSEVVESRLGYINDSVSWIAFMFLSINDVPTGISGGRFITTPK